MADSNRCPDCDRPLATEEEYFAARSETEFIGAAKCFRGAVAGRCGLPIDWRARALAAEAERDEALAYVAELREAAARVTRSAGPGRGCWTVGRHEVDALREALAATPTDLAAARDRRVGAEALRVASKACDKRSREVVNVVCAQTWAACARMLRARAEEVAIIGHARAEEVERG